MSGPPATGMFIDQRQNEDLVHETRLHWIRPVSRAILPVLIFAGMAFYALPLLSQRSWPEPVGLLILTLIIGVPALALLWIGWLYYDWIDDVLVLTNRRIVWFERTLLMRERRQEIPLDQIQNVTIQTDGWLEAWFEFGSLQIDAAGGHSLKVEGVPHPSILRQLIIDSQATRRRQLQEQVQQAVNSEIVTAVDAILAGAWPVPLSTATGSGPARITWHRHWWFLARASLRGLVLTLLPFIALTQLQHLPQVSGYTEELRNPLILALLALIALGLGQLVWEILTWRDDIYTIEGDRLRDIHKLPFGLHYEEKQTSLGNIQDVSYDIPGPLAYLLDFGNVVIETAGKQQFTFDGVANPRAVQAEISRRLDLARDAAAAAQQRANRQANFEILDTYHGRHRELHT